MSHTLESTRLLLIDSLGAESFDELTAGDQRKMDSVINSVYQDTYFPANGISADWSEQTKGQYLPGPETFSVTVTQGSNVATGLSLDDKWAGCVVRFNEDNWNIFAGIDSSSNPLLVFPWKDDSGTYSAKVYYNAFNLSNNVIRIEETPQVLGKGLLYPIGGDEHLARIRTLWYGDFIPQVTQLPNFSYPKRNFDRSNEFATGDPYYYFISNGNVRAEFKIGQRFVVYPLPDEPTSIQYNAIQGPPLLSATTDVIQIPDDLYHSAFIHLCEFQVSARFPDYDGKNQRELGALAAKAEEKLRNRTQTQKRTGGKVRLSSNW